MYALDWGEYIRGSLAGNLQQATDFSWQPLATFTALNTSYDSLVKGSNASSDSALLGTEEGKLEGGLSCLHTGLPHCPSPKHRDSCALNEAPEGFRDSSLWVLPRDSGTLSPSVRQRTT